MIDKRTLRKKTIIKLFELDKKANRPDVVVDEILSWTNDRSILTQKLCRLLSESETFIHTDEEAEKVEQLVQTRLINHWETQPASEHLQTMRETLLNNQECDSTSLLLLYHKVLQEGEVSSDGSPAQAELLSLGLLIRHQDTLKVANRIYESVFDRNWVEKALASSVQSSPAQNTSSEEASIPIHAEVSEPSQTMQEGSLNDQQHNSSSLVSPHYDVLQAEEISSEEPPAPATLLNLEEGAPQQDNLKGVNQIDQSVSEQNGVENAPTNSLQLSSLPQNASNQADPVILSADARSTISSSRNLIAVRNIWVLLGIAGLLIVGFNLFRWLQVETIFKRGNERLSQKNYQQAIEEYNQLLKLDSNYYQAWTNRGYGLAGLKEYSKMLESCTTATIIQPKSTYAWNCQGEALFNLKRYNEAIAAFDKGIALNPTDPIFWINKTEALITLNQADTAITTINQAIELLEQIQSSDRKDEIVRELSVAWSHKGKALAQKQEYEAALKAYEQSLTYNQNYFPALRGKGMMLNSLQRPDEAIAQFQQLINRSETTDEQKAEAGYYLGLTLCQTNQRAKAIDAFDKALSIKPDYQAAEQARKNCLN